MAQDRDQPGAVLGNYGNKDATPGQSVGIDPGFTEQFGAPGASRRAALALRERLWSVSSLADVRKCGKVPHGQYMPLRTAPSGFHLTGLCTCGSVWVCPVCAPNIRAGRGTEIAAAVGSRLGDGGAVTFGTGTLSHAAKHSLRSTYSLVVDAWSAVREDRGVRAFKKANGYWGFVRTAEVTHGDNGWHPHLHWLDFWEEALSAEDMERYQRAVYGAWSRCVARLGSRYSSPTRGILVLPVRDGEAKTIANYVTEMSVSAASYELTSISTKQARQGGLAPFEILAKVYGPGSKPWVDLWWEYEQATRGRRMLGTSRGLLARLGVDEEESEPKELGDVVAFVRTEDWGQIRWFTDAGLAGVQAVLESAAAGGQMAVDAAVRVLLGLPVHSLLEPDSEPLQLGPGDDGGMF
jgi:hypothetical protein